MEAVLTENYEAVKLSWAPQQEPSQAKCITTTTTVVVYNYISYLQ